MFSRPCPLLLVLLLILRCNTTSSNELMTSFCLSTDTHSHTGEATTHAPQQENTEEQRRTAPSQERSLKMNPSSPRLSSTRRSQAGGVLPGFLNYTAFWSTTISSLCEDHDIKWVPKVLRAYEWCLTKGYAPKQDSSEISLFTFNQFLDAVTPEACCYLFGQTPAKVFMTQGEKISNGCEQISFNVTLQTSTSDCTGNNNSLAHGFIRTMYNCLKWAF